MMANDSSASSASCLLLSDDFLFGSRLCEAIKGRGHRVTMAASMDTSTTAKTWELVIFDLTLAAPTIEEVASWRETLAPPPRLLAFGPHVRTGSLTRAKEAGCELVLTRGQLDQQLEVVLDEYLPN